jgi:glycosyltransferase involved in cell wall biosynthesis
MIDPKISIVIPTLNSDETFDKCLASIRANNYRTDYEIIVVDAGSTDQTVALARKYNATVLNGLPNRINRNIGIEQAKGDIICFTDSDCLVPQDWLIKLVDGLLKMHEEDPLIVGVGGGNIPWLDNPSLEQLAIARAWQSPLITFKARNAAAYKDRRYVSHNPPLNAAVFRQVILEAGGFEEDPGYGYGEDSALDSKLIANGYKLCYLPDCIVRHRHAASYGKFARQMYVYGHGRIKLGRRHKGYLSLYHYGPVFLCAMTFSPFIFIPLSMAIVNAGFMSFKDRNLRLFLPIIRLTMSFYLNYGHGEIVALREGA